MLAYRHTGPVNGRIHPRFRGVSSTTSSRPNRRTSAPGTWDQRCCEIKEAFTPARFAIWQLAASKTVIGGVSAMTLNVSGVSA